MRLQQLEIKGFKSFANETIINFNENVIGIVGPNGSGKSNIVDAIRWVLGEQKSKELRLDQMSSVIFNGTKDKKQGSMAQVSLTFKNTRNLLPTEYENVKITRVLYRSGESEYRLNGVTCRLKDITSLFLDTGIGSNSYAIIALGMVDDILTDKENSRRKMFEQAAGISKYKIRKRETINKLRSTTEDLNRIEDLLFEIEGNLKNLEKQARRAKKYFQLKEDYKNTSINLALIRMDHLKSQHHSIKKQLEGEEDKLRQTEIDIKGLESELEKEKKANLDKERALSDRQRDLNSLIGRIRGMENDKKMQQQKLQFIQRTKDKLAVTIESAQEKLAQLETDLEFYETEVNAETRIEIELEEELQKAEDQLGKIKTNHAQMKSGMDEEIRIQQLAEKKRFEIEKEKAVLLNQIKSYKSEIERGDIEINNRKKEIASVKEAIEESEELENQKQRVIHEMEATEEQRKMDLQLVIKEYEEIRNETAKVDRILDASRNEMKLVKSMIENLEGFPESIRFLSNSKQWKADAQLFSDLIYVKDEYRVAIENYLEPYLNYYVVNNKEEAYQAIQLLEQSQQGKANFFILDTLSADEPESLVLSELTRAIDAVDVDEKYRKLCNSLLHNVLISPNDEISGDLPEDGYVVLGKSGRIIKRKTAVSGGSVGLFEGKKIGRKKNLEILEKKIKTLQEQAKTLKQKGENLKKKEDQLRAKKASHLIAKEKEALNKILQEKVTFTTRLENFEQFIQRANQKKGDLESEIEEIELEERTLNRELLESEDTIQGIKDKIAGMDGSFKEIANQLSESSANFNQKKIDFIRQQNKVQTLKKELGFHQNQIQETKKNKDEAVRSIKQNDSEIEEITNHLEDLENNLVDSYSLRKEREQSLTDIEKVYFDARANINQVEDKIRKVNRQRQDSQMLTNQLKDKFNEVKYDISAVAQRLRIEFNININELLKQQTPEGMVREELEMKVEKIRKRLDNYGEVNPMAVEAYDEMKERFDTISKQRDDIVDAKESLMETIKEIEETATLQFLEAFDKARVYFINVFRSLFTQDDNCDLILLDPENPLDSKIEIVAKPKGKRPQSISQLSGGEKTLTATALLFALYLLKPAPFCIFDEVDAPLDDANIYKFNKIIKKFSEDSQFIIVTHNKLTMAAVDTIYGVFAVQGVSGVSPVDFTHLDHVGSFETSGS